MSDTYDDADIYGYDILDYEQCEFCGKYLRDYEVDIHRCLNGNLMRKIVDDRIKWMMARKQEKARASNTVSSN